MIHCSFPAIDWLTHDITVDLASGLPQHRPLCAQLTIPATSFAQQKWKLPKPLTDRQKVIISQQPETQIHIESKSIQTSSSQVEKFWMDALQTSAHP